MSLELFANIYREYGFEFSINDNEIHLDVDDCKVRIPIDSDWVSSINSFYKAKQYDFDSENRLLTAYRKVEFQVVRVDPTFLPRPEHEFLDTKGNKVILNTATPEFVLAILNSDSKEIIIELVKKRIKRRYERMRRPESGVKMKIEDILVIPHTVRYEIPRKIKRETLIARGTAKVKSCLFKLAYSYNECWELRGSIKSIGTSLLEIENDVDLSIPRATYVEDLVSLYKVARSSQFPNQAFLSYYHVLEYYFLRVSDEHIYKEVKSHVNSINFNSSYENINKLLSIIKRNDNTSDETEMLKAVLNKYTREEDLIEFMLSLEKSSGINHFSNTKKIVLGEKATIKLEKGHALSNTAKVIKHIRNSLVHSSDRYNREDCFLPFSEAESVVREYIPVIKYLAESVIFATAE